MRNPPESFLAQRAESLAYVHLSRLPNLHVHRQHGSDLGLDYLVEITRNGEPTGRFFAVEVKGTNSERARLPKQVWALSHPEIPMPVCLLVFTLQNDKGYFAWIKEPIGSNLVLRSINESVKLQELTTDKLADAVSKVQSWYESL